VYQLPQLLNRFIDQAEISPISQGRPQYLPKLNASEAETIKLVKVSHQRTSSLEKIAAFGLLKTGVVKAYASIYYLKKQFKPQHLNHIDSSLGRPYRIMVMIAVLEPTLFVEACLGIAAVVISVEWIITGDFL